MADQAAPEMTPRQAAQQMASRRFVGLLVIVSIIGVVVSVAAWCFLELIYQLQQELYTHLPHALGFSSAPAWWPLPVLAVSGVVVALAITELPGDGGHLPANGLAAGGAPHPEYLPSVLLAGIGTIGFGMVLGPEAPLIALGSGLALLLVRFARTPMQPPVLAVIAGAGAFAAVSFIFGSPMIAAVLIIELLAIGGPRLTLVLVPGLLAAGIGALVSLGIGAFTGLSSSSFALVPLAVPHFSHLTFVDFLWTIAMAVAIAAVTRVIMVGGLRTHSAIKGREMLALPAIGLIVAGLAILFGQVTDKGSQEVLFSGQSALPGLISQASTWSVGALLLVIVCKGVGYSLALGSFRGGPTFPALYLGAAAGILMSRLPGFDFGPAVAVGIGASMVSVLRLPLSSVVVATVITLKAGTTDEPLIIVGVVVAYLVTLLLSEVIGQQEQPSAAATAPAPAQPVGAGSPP